MNISDIPTKTSNSNEFFEYFRAIFRTIFRTVSFTFAIQGQNPNSV